MESDKSKMIVHHELLEQLYQAVQDTGLSAVAELEMDIACGVDAYGKNVNSGNLQAKVRDSLNGNLSREIKLRLLMLLFCCVDIDAKVRSSLIDAANLAPEDNDVIDKFVDSQLPFA